MDLEHLLRSVDVQTTFVGLMSIVMTGFGIAIVSVAKWIRPKLDDILDAMPKIVEGERSSKEIIKSLSASFAILSRIMHLQYQELRKRRMCILIIEDNPVDAKVISNICHDAAKKHKLSIKDVSSLLEASTMMSLAVVTVMDVELPDSSIELINAFINMSDSPVIIYSSNEYGRSSFPDAYAIISKPETKELDIEITRALESAITEFNHRAEF